MPKNARQKLLWFLVSPFRISLAWLPLLLCVAGWSLAMVIIRPTIGIPDILVAEQMGCGIYTDWYAPIHAATFRLLIQFQERFGFEHSVQGLPYLFYVTVLWSGLFLTLCPGNRFWRCTAVMPRWMVLAVLFALGAIGSNLLIFSKSTSNCYWNLAVWLLAVGLLSNMPKRLIPKVFVAVITLFFLYYGTALRHNLVLALFPLLCWLVWHFCHPTVSFRRTSPSVVVIIAVAAALWGFYVFLNHYVSYTVLKTYRTYVLQERCYADIFMLNFYAPWNYKNPPNSFGNRFDDLTKELFLSKYDPSSLHVKFAFDRINDILPVELTFQKEFVKVLPEEQFLELKSLALYFDEKTLKLSDKPPGSKILALNEREVLEQYPKDHIVLRNAWIARIMQDPLIYLRIKVFWWMRTMLLGRTSGRGVGSDLIPPEFFPVRLLSGGLINGFTMFCVMTLFSLYLFSPKRLEPQIFPFLMPAWSALLTALPLILFIPDDSFRYLFYFFAASFISIIRFLANSPLFAAMVQTVQQHVKQKDHAHCLTDVSASDLPC